MRVGGGHRGESAGLADLGPTLDHHGLSERERGFSLRPCAVAQDTVPGGFLLSLLRRYRTNRYVEV